MEDSKQQMLTTISSYTGKLLRDHFGKGPESVFVSAGSTYFNIYIRNFLSPIERVLLEQGQEMVVRELRMKMMDKLLPELREFLEETTGQRVRELYYDWGFVKCSGVIFGICDRPFELSDEVDEQYAGRNELDALINQISKETEKQPELTYSFLLNERTLIVIRKGILVRIEEELIRIGHGEILRRVKSNLEKRDLQNSQQFELILHRRVVDSFVDWDFERNKSVIILILQPST
ncbi:Na-translocating system protein MpsC family protein [Tumebacillus sp. DT12]|uniref:Na-translocating system protein MpsC family protein n=1 Tax=Tumebacillus lacus TaxID=2995335 RepID=A0ABT3X4R2_9BACL|nr:Na-translocating system protein MpsC family protein [Tumebacillus lacus]MCX7571888.1 Na-translocating system protein MpsC family protein [Tumebacillus lacus]